MRTIINSVMIKEDQHIAKRASLPFYLIAVAFVLVQLCTLELRAQTGPAGVGNSSTNKIWLDANHLTGIAHGAQLGTFVDRSGNGWHANQYTVSSRPRYFVNQLNGKPMVRFDRTATIQFMQITTPGVGAAFSNSNVIFVV